MSIKFFIQSKNSPAVIYVRVRIGRDVDAKAKTKLVADLKDWNVVKHIPNSKTENGKKLELEISKITTKLISEINNCNDIINSDWLKGILQPIVVVKKKALSDYLIDYIDYYAIVKHNEIKPSSHKKIRVYQNLLKRFESYSKEKYLIKDVNESFQKEFDKYCISDGYANNTISRCIKFIKYVCNHAKNNGIETHPQLQALKKKTQEIIKISLTEDEINLIQNVELKEDYLINARDWLIISCETGQRVSDFMRFDKNMIRIDDGVELIEFSQIKTLENMSIPLNSKVLNILKFRNGDFPRKISAQKYNKYIKEVCEKAGITALIEGSKKDIHTNRKITGKFPKWELVSSHIGRRSYATNYFGKIPTSLLMYATGHRTERQFYDYVGKKDTNMAHQLNSYYKQLNK